MKPLVSTSAENPFPQLLLDRVSASSSCLCVGLDPDVDRIPDHLDSDDIGSLIVAFNNAIIEATHPYVSAFKLNLAFYERHGAAGWNALAATLAAIPSGIVKIADAKRGDIGNTAGFYAQAFFESLDFDACTLSPYMGEESIAPFCSYPEKGVFVLCRTSNASADDFQLHGDTPLYLEVARLAGLWDSKYPSTVGLVAGATRIDDLRRIRSAAPRLPLLVPGVGAQGADPAEVISACRSTNGPVLVNSSRSVLYASPGRDFAEAAGKEAERLASVLKA